MTYLEYWESPYLRSKKRQSSYSALTTDLTAMLRPALQTLTSSSTVMSSISSPVASEGGGGGAGGVVGDTTGAPALHWRYQLLILWEVLHLARPDLPPR